MRSFLKSLRVCNQATWADDRRKRRKERPTRRCALFQHVFWNGFCFSIVLCVQKSEDLWLSAFCLCFDCQMQEGPSLCARFTCVATATSELSANRDNDRVCFRLDNEFTGISKPFEAPRVGAQLEKLRLRSSAFEKLNAPGEFACLGF